MEIWKFVQQRVMSGKRDTWCQVLWSLWTEHVTFGLFWEISAHGWPLLTWCRPRKLSLTAVCPGFITGVTHFVPHCLFGCGSWSYPNTDLDSILIAFGRAFEISVLVVLSEANWFTIHHWCEANSGGIEFKNRLYCTSCV